MRCFYFNAGLENRGWKVEEGERRPVPSSIVHPPSSLGEHSCPVP
jgi:hypothetical protein